MAEEEGKKTNDHQSDYQSGLSKVAAGVRSVVGGRSGWVRYRKPETPGANGEACGGASPLGSGGPGSRIMSPYLFDLDRVSSTLLAFVTLFEAIQL